MGVMVRARGGAVIGARSLRISIEHARLSLALLAASRKGDLDGLETTTSCLIVAGAADFSGNLLPEFGGERMRQLLHRSEAA